MRKVLGLRVSESLVSQQYDFVVDARTYRKPMKPAKVGRNVRAFWQSEYQPSGTIHDKLQSSELIFRKPEI